MRLPSQAENGALAYERALWTLIIKSAHYFRRWSPVVSKAFAVHQMG